MAKAEKKAEEKKTSEAAPKPKTKRTPVDTASTIHLITGDNVKARREGSNVAKIFAVYREGMTVADFLEKSKSVGGGISNLQKDITCGRVKLQAPKG